MNTPLLIRTAILAFGLTVVGAPSLLGQPYLEPTVPPAPPRPTPMWPAAAPDLMPAGWVWQKEFKSASFGVQLNAAPGNPGALLGLTQWGVSSSDPNFRLSSIAVVGGTNKRDVVLNAMDAEDIIIANRSALPNGNLYDGAIRFSTTPPGSIADIERVTILNDGKVGIGTKQPRALTRISGSPNTNPGAGSVGAIMEVFDASATGSNTTYGGIAFGSNPGVDFSIGKKTENNTTYFQIRKQQGTELVTVAASGNVGIGTIPDATYKLSVNGPVRAKEVCVETGWSDFVFEEGYDLMPIDSLATYIKANGHLPEIPTAAEVERNGIGIGKISSKLLQKIEELTLYMIELQRENEALKERVAAVESGR